MAINIARFGNPAALPARIFESIINLLPSSRCPHTCLSNGLSVPLTSNTLTEPAALRREIDLLRSRNVAFDDHEIRDDLFCLAVPVTVLTFARNWRQVRK